MPWGGRGFGVFIAAISALSSTTAWPSVSPTLRRALATYDTAVRWLQPWKAPGRKDFCSDDGGVEPALQLPTKEEDKTTRLRGRGVRYGTAAAGAAAGTTGLDGDGEIATVADGE